MIFLDKRPAFAAVQHYTARYQSDWVYILPYPLITVMFFGYVALQQDIRRILFG
jgi:hypothetical protein